MSYEGPFKRASDEQPEPDQLVFVIYVTGESMDAPKRVLAQYVRQREVDAEYADIEFDMVDWDDQDNAWCPAGWYARDDEFGDLEFLEGTVIGWCELPDMPPAEVIKAWGANL